jgi:hypothetical protein
MFGLGFDSQKDWQRSRVGTALLTLDPVSAA